MSPQTLVPSRPRPTTRCEAAQLLRAAGDGDDAAWHELVARFGGLVWSVARNHRLSHADAGDVVQCTWLKLVQHLGAIKDPEAVGPWLMTTARRECLRVIDGAKSQVLFGDDLPEPPGEDVELDADLPRIEHELLWQAVSHLRPREQALVRKLVSDPPASYAEISAALDMPIGSIGPTRARCLEQLRARYERLRVVAA